MAARSASALGSLSGGVLPGIVAVILDRILMDLTLSGGCLKRRLSGAASHETQRGSIATIGGEDVWLKTIDNYGSRVVRS